MNIIDILVPDLPESISNATVLAWKKKIGDYVHRNEILVEIETDKVILEISAPISGILETLLEKEGTIVIAKQILGTLNSKIDICKNEHSNVFHESIISSLKQNNLIKSYNIENKNIEIDRECNNKLTPSSRRIIAEYDLDIKKIQGSGIGGRITKEDVKQYIFHNKTSEHNIEESKNMENMNNRYEKRIPMTQLRKCIATRLVSSKNDTAMLTTFNEVNMKKIINLRKKYGKIFEDRHNIRLGYMSFYIKAVLEALKRFPNVNASIDGDEIVYRNYFDVSIAISTPRGLVTPVIKNIDLLSMADIEKYIKALAIKGYDGKLTIEELTGGNFTITNGGVFGSLISTPIINPPQSAILGMHIIKDRVMAYNGQVVILPMMYLALSYDHRIIDGNESINFLITVKDILEDPYRLLLNI